MSETVPHAAPLSEQGRVPRPRLAARTRQARWLGALLSCLTLATGCVRVAAYERETLARPDMELGGHPDLVAGEEHGMAYREGSSGGGSAKGGGCGCN